MTGVQTCALPISGAGRIATLPDVPTLRENGIEMTGLADGVWFGITAPRALSADLVAKLNGALNKALQTADVRDKLGRLDVTAAGGTPESFGQLIATQLAYWRDAMKVAGVTPE